MESLQNQMEVQYKKAFFSKIKEDLEKNPPDTQHISIIVQELVDGLCKFVPNKSDIHRLIKDDILCKTIGVETMPKIINGLIYWIEQFQAPAHDSITKTWRDDFKKTRNFPEFIALFLEEYYQHTAKAYKELWEARKRLANGENIVPPEHRPAVTGKNGVPENMRSGLDR
jgi:hypothetical protein